MLSTWMSVTAFRIVFLQHLIERQSTVHNLVFDRIVDGVRIVYNILQSGMLNALLVRYASAAYPAGHFKEYIVPSLDRNSDYFYILRPTTTG